MASGGANDTVLTLFYRVTSLAMKVVSLLAIAVLLLSFLAMVVPYLEGAQSFRLIGMATEAERQIGTLVRETIPTRIGGKDLTRIIVIIGMFILSGTFGRASERFAGKAQYLTYKRTFDRWRSDMHLSENAVLLSPLNQKLEQIKKAKRKDREQLLKDFAEAKKRLDEMGRDLAFLSIDVADSTGMKEGEERGIIEHDFKEYKRFVERALVAQGSLKSAWTPDGVMSCFTSVDAAVKAAREVITGLDAFNRNVKTMKRDFMVRCGVNTGFVYFDESVPLEEISDRTIDIAAHMQKNARPDSVCVAKPAIEPLNDRIGFEPSGKVVDGYEVYEWRKA
jgi:class 3 adenylate cyclase